MGLGWEPAGEWRWSPFDERDSVDYDFCPQERWDKSDYAKSVDSTRYRQILWVPGELYPLIYILYLDMYQQYFRETLKFSLCIVMIEAKIPLKVSSMGLSTDPFSRRHPLIQRIQSGYQPVTSLDTNHPA